MALKIGKLYKGKSPQAFGKNPIIARVYQNQENVLIPGAKFLCPFFPLYMTNTFVVLEHVVLDKAVLENAYIDKIVKINVYKLLIDGDCERIGWCLLPNDGSWVEVTH